MKKRLIAIIFTLLAGVLAISGCSGSKELITCAADLNKKEYKIGTVQGPAPMYVTEEQFANAQISYYANVSDGYTAFASGQLDAFVYTNHVLKYYANTDNTMTIIPEPVGYASICAGIKKGNTALAEKINEFIEVSKNDGTLADMENRWVEKGNLVMPEIQMPENPSGTLTIATEGLDLPFTFFGQDGELNGLDIEFGKRLAAYLGMEVKFVSSSFDSLIPYLDSGKADIILNQLNKTAEREKSIDFSGAYFVSPVCVAVKADRYKPVNTGFSQLSDFSGKTIAIAQASALDIPTSEKISGLNYDRYNDDSSGIEAVKARKADAVVLDEPVARLAAAANPDLMVFPQVVAEDDYAFCFTKGSPLTEKFNAAIKELKSTGKLDELKEYWVNSSGEKKLEPQKSSGKNGTVKIAIDPSFEPMVYLNGEGEIVGYDIAICTAICDMLDMKAEYTIVSRSAFVEYVSSGKADMSCGAVSITEERSLVMDFSEPTYNGGIMFLIRKDSYGAEISGGAEAAQKSFGESLSDFFEGIKNSFIRTFITENRWKLVLNGLLVTIVISLCAFLLGSILGGGVCALLRSHRKLLNLFARGYVRLLQGTPIVVLLMILYYVILKDVDISAIIVAIIGFSLNLAAYTSEIFRTAIESVDRGQIEASYAIGFNKVQTFFKIILPQAAKNALPVYKGEFISLVKSTSIVGYIAIQDLTKASDIIRSRTYEAFFPLITTAIIYFAVTYLFIVLLNALERKIDPKRRKRTLKGVDCK